MHAQKLINHRVVALVAENLKRHAVVLRSLLWDLHKATCMGGTGPDNYLKAYNHNP